MFVVMVHARVKLEKIQDFITATLDNARNSLLEPGIARFDVYQQSIDPSLFTLVEIYRSEVAPASHRETTHYKRWRSMVDDMMAEPRSRNEYKILFPPELGG
jgi:(4S)-4-hydroxy-5-phosphonooxypentane-2,3-dione isomerase